MPRITFMIALCLAAEAIAADIRVPAEHPTIQAAINAASAGDTVLVSAGRYKERIALRAGIVVRSAGDDAKGMLGLKRAEATILDGGGKAGDQPGVVMAEGATLDGFTITNVGYYDEATWKKHYDTHGEELGDDEGAVQAEGTTAAVSVRGVNCAVINNIVHHNGDVGVAVMGSKDRRVAPTIAANVSYRNLGGGIGVAEGAHAVVRDNVCFENLRAGIGCRAAAPLIFDNVCYKNIRAGIGCREGAAPVVRGNRCYQNRRAGIGCRMEGTSPVIEKNECYENEMAGIGIRDGATPVIRDNKCHRNKLAGIGSDGSAPLIIGNECRENDMAGIGLRGRANATLLRNKCIENKLVAIGVTDGSTATLKDNEVSRTGGMPPLIAVKDGSQATLLSNRIEGGGVAALLVQGTVSAAGNTFVGKGGKQSNAVWVWENSTATVSDNSFDGYRAAVNAAKARVVVEENTITGTSGPAVVVKDSTAPARVVGNVLVSDDAKATVVDITGPAGAVDGNVVKSVGKDSPR